MGKPSSAKKRQKKGDASDSAIAEAIRIRISRAIERFRSSQDEVYTFEANLSSHERAAVHELCRRMGMRSKSSGRGDQRRVSVFKAKKIKAVTTEAVENLTSLTFSEESRKVLQDLFMHYPPGEEETGEEKTNEHEGNSHNKRGGKDDMFCRPRWNKAEVAKKVESFASKVGRTPKLKKIVEERSKLPIAVFRDVITSTIESHQVVLISGETGCGKTTQVPQFILDYLWGKGEACKIVCTQPRRISATSVAERIAHERGENIGENVGYKIRLESKGGRHSSILFCTNGILLRVLVSHGTNGTLPGASSRKAEKDISEITHIIVDEIHERDRYSDFALAILRDLLPAYPNLRLVLMSATLDAERFSQYFGGCPVIRVPGFTYPVKTFYLEEVLTILKSTEKNLLDATLSSFSIEEPEFDEEYRAALDDAISLACSNDEFDPLLELVSSKGAPRVFNYQHSSTGVTPLMAFAGKGRIGDICMLLSLGADCSLQAHDGSIALDWARRGGQVDAANIITNRMENASTNCNKEQELLDKYMSTSNPELIDVVLIGHLLGKICIDSKDGAILVFLPGWDDINRTRQSLLSNPFFMDSSRFLILSLHSMVPSAEQKKVFKRPAPGCRKIILSTNIAETAITIDDVVYVLDSGRMKEKSYDPYNNVSTLQSSWISKASAKQREGRAGRCQPGVCYHLYSKLRAASLAEFQVPEIRRIPIEELCLQVKLLDPNYKIEEFLRKTLDPPVFKTIRNAITVLQEIGALSHDEMLTELGKKLGSLPVHPLTSKMLFFAILLNCLDPALTLACAADYRDPFTLPMLSNEKKQADAARAELASLFGGHSDQLAVIAAFDCWRSAKEKGQEARFCSEYFVSSNTMNMLFRMRKQLQSELVRHGYISDDISSCSQNARDSGIVHAILVAGLYPMVGRLQPPHKNGKRIMVETASGDKARLHSHAINFKLPKKCDDRPLIMYDEVTRGDGGLIIRNCTVIGPLPLLLLATEISVAPAKGSGDDNDEDDNDSDSEEFEDYSDEDETEMFDGSRKQGDRLMSSPDNTVTIVVDRWLSFESTALEVAQIYCLRERLSAAVFFKVTNPRKVLPPVLGASIYAIACLLSYDGLSGISVPVESVDTLTSMVNAAEIGKSAPGKKHADQVPHGFLRSLFKHTGHRHTASHHYNKLKMGGPPGASQLVQLPLTPAHTGPSPRPSLIMSVPPVASQLVQPPLTAAHAGPSPRLCGPPVASQHVQPPLTLADARPSPRASPRMSVPPVASQLVPPPLAPAPARPSPKVSEPPGVSQLVHPPLTPTHAGPSFGPSPRMSVPPVASQHVPPPMGPGPARPSSKVSGPPGASQLVHPPLTPTLAGPSPKICVPAGTSQLVMPPLTSADAKPSPMQVIEKVSLAGYGSDLYGPYGPRGDSSKRPRGK